VARLTLVVALLFLCPLSGNAIIDLTPPVPVAGPELGAEPVIALTAVALSDRTVVFWSDRNTIAAGFVDHDGKRQGESRIIASTSPYVLRMDAARAIDGNILIAWASGTDVLWAILNSELSIVRAPSTLNAPTGSTATSVEVACTSGSCVIAWSDDTVHAVALTADASNVTAARTFAADSRVDSLAASHDSFLLTTSGNSEHTTADLSLLLPDLSVDMFRTVEARSCVATWNGRFVIACMTAQTIEVTEIDGDLAQTRPPFVIAPAPSAFRPSSVSIASIDGGYAVAFLYEYCRPQDLGCQIRWYSMRFDVLGRPVDPEPVEKEQFSSIVRATDRYLLLSSESVIALPAFGTRGGPEPLVVKPKSQRAEAIGASSTGALVVWSETNTGPTSRTARGQRVDGAGTPIGEPVRIGDGASHTGIASDGRDYLVTFHNGFSSGVELVWIDGYTGTITARKTLTLSYFMSRPVWTGASYAFVIQREGLLRLIRVDSHGEIRGEHPIESIYTNSAWVGAGENTIAVVWNSTSNGNARMMTFDQEGRVLLPPRTFWFAQKAMYVTVHENEIAIIADCYDNHPRLVRVALDGTVKSAEILGEGTDVQVLRVPAGRLAIWYQNGTAFARLIADEVRISPQFPIPSLSPSLIASIDDHRAIMFHSDHDGLAYVQLGRVESGRRRSVAR
jgi:hypothetical protein